MRFYRRMVASLACVALIFGAGASAFAVEMTLAGIKLGRPSSDVLKKFGSPTRVTVGTVAVDGQTGVNQPGSPAGGPFGGPSISGLTGAVGSAVTSYGNALNSAMEGALPGITGLPAPPAFPGIPGFSGTQPGQPGQNPNQITETETTWTYDLPDGTTAEFIISETGQIVQITVGGDKPYPGSKTTKGIKIGSSYKDVLLKYGYPEGQQYVNRQFLRVKYSDKHRVIFTMLDRKVVGVTIALKDTED